MAATVNYHGLYQQYLLNADVNLSVCSGSKSAALRNRNIGIAALASVLARGIDLQKNDTRDKTLWREFCNQKIRFYIYQISFHIFHVKNHSNYIPEIVAADAELAHDLGIEVGYSLRTRSAEPAKHLGSWPRIERNHLRLDQMKCDPPDRMASCQHRVPDARHRYALSGVPGAPAASVV